MFFVVGSNKHQSAVTCLQFNNRFVITSSDDGTVKLWDVKTGNYFIIKRMKFTLAINYIMIFIRNTEIILFGGFAGCDFGLIN